MPTDPDPRLVESVVERRIREAMERGEFDGLPGAGRPIEGIDRGYDPDWWVKRWVEREQLADLVAELRRTTGKQRARLDAGLGGEAGRSRLTDLEDRLAAAEERLAGERPDAQR